MVVKRLTVVVLVIEVDVEVEMDESVKMVLVEMLMVEVILVMVVGTEQFQLIPQGPERELLISLHFGVLASALALLSGFESWKEYERSDNLTLSIDRGGNGDRMRPSPAQYFPVHSEHGQPDCLVLIIFECLLDGVYRLSLSKKEDIYYRICNASQPDENNELDVNFGYRDSAK
ncbi:Ephrin Type-A Receptor 6 [Manis pentadactyla]|nr:Ephrin Type-A Receptor 6 [Manis pentadactyla]